MEQVKVRVSVSLAAAVGAGRSSYGETDVKLTDAEVASLSPEARAVLCDDGRPRTRGYRYEALSVADTSTATVLAALECRGAEVAIERAERAEADARASAEQEARLVTALAASDAEWIEDAGWGGPRIKQWSVNPTDARFVARRAQVESGALAVARAELQARTAAAEEAKRAAVEAKQLAETACAAALREFAVGVPELARAATDGYPIDRATLDGIADDLADAFGDEPCIGQSRVYVAVDTKCWDSPEDRAAPTPETFALRDRIVEAAAEANAQLPPAIGQWVVSRIVRVDMCPHAGEKHYVTAVLATLRTPCGAREVTWSLEDMSCDHDDEG